MNIKQFIESNPELKVLNYKTVYKTITTLIGSGMLSMSDFPNHNYTNIINLENLEEE